MWSVLSRAAEVSGTTQGVVSNYCRKVDELSVTTHHGAIRFLLPIEVTGSWLCPCRLPRLSALDAVLRGRYVSRERASRLTSVRRSPAAALVEAQGSRS